MGFDNLREGMARAEKKGWGMRAKRGGTGRDTMGVRAEVGRSRVAEEIRAAGPGKPELLGLFCWAKNDRNSENQLHLNEIRRYCFGFVS
jgi:hypothetical protein